MRTKQTELNKKNLVKQNSFGVKQAVILAAGKGTRAKPFTLVKPKPLLKIFNKTILEHNLDQLDGVVKEVILVVGYKGEMIEELIGKRYKNLKIKYIWQKSRVGTGNAVKKALPKIKGKFILMNGDDLYGRADFLRCLKKFPCISLAETANPENFGQVVVEKDIVKKIIEKPKNPISDLVNCGLYFLDKSIFDSKIKKSLRGEYEMTDYIKNFIKEKNMYWAAAKKWTPFSLSPYLLKENIFLMYPESAPPDNGKSEKGVSNGARRPQEYVIGVDGGGTKTAAILADLEGRILKRARTGPSNPRNIGVKRAVKNIALAIEKVLGKNKNVSSVFIGMPAVEEEFKSKKEIIEKELLKHKKISSIFKGKVIIGSDQLVGFRAGTEKKDGIVVISSSGCLAHGWLGEKEAKISGWGYLTEQGSAFSVGQKGLQAVWKDLDGRGPETLITGLIFQEFKIKNKEEIIEKVYSKNTIDIVSSLSILVDQAAKKKDKIARKILTEAGRELALSANTAIKKLNFQEMKFPLVLIGSMFKSKIVANTAKRRIKKITPNAEFIIPQKEPAVGAVKLAIKELKDYEF